MEKNVLAGAGWMLVLAFLLGWIPVIGPFVAGFIGGRKAGAPGAALVAAILPALAAGAVVWLLVYVLPDVGAVIATLFAGAFVVWLLVQMGLLLLGALVGGAMAPETTHRGRPVV